MGLGNPIHNPAVIDFSAQIPLQLIELELTGYKFELDFGAMQDSSVNFSTITS